MEFILEQCCEAELDAGLCLDDGECSDSHEFTEGDCGPCIDSPLLLLLQREDEQPFLFTGVHSTRTELPTVLAKAPTTALTFHHETARAHAEGTVSLIARTVVLTC
jgi:hypothetical protein